MGPLSAGPRTFGPDVGPAFPVTLKRSQQTSMSSRRLLGGFISLCVALGPIEPAFAAGRRPQIVPGAEISAAAALAPVGSLDVDALQPLSPSPALTASAPISNPALARAGMAPPTPGVRNPAGPVPQSALGVASAGVGAALRAMPEPDSASAGDMYRAGVELESAVSAGAVGKLARRSDGSWRAVRPDAGGLTSHVLTSLRLLRREGIDLPYRRMSLTGAGLTAEGERSNHLLIGAQELGRLQESARSQGLALSDKIVQRLVRRHLEEGIVEPLRLDGEESAAAGFGHETALTAAQAVEVYRENWRKKLDSFLNQLDLNWRAPSPDSYALKGCKGKIVAVYPDPVSRSLLLVRSNGLVERRGIDGQGRIAENRDNLHKFAGGTEAVYFDPISRRLGIARGRGAVVSIDIDDPRSDRGHVVTPLESAPISYDPPSRTLVTRDFDALHLWKLSPDGFLADTPFQTVQTSQMFLVAAAVMDRKGGDFGTLITLGVTGRVEVRPLKADGRLQEEPISSVLAVESGSLDGLLAVDSDLRLLYLYSAEARRVAVARLHDDGSIDESSVFLLPALPAPVSGIYVDPRSHSLLMFADDSRVLRYDGSRLAPDRALPKALILDTLTAVLPDADAELARSIFRHVAEVVESSGGLNLVKEVAASIVAPAFLKEASKTAKLRAVPGSFQWFQDAEAVLQRRMPDLWRALHDPVEMGGLLCAVSLLRFLFRYDGAKTMTEAAVAFAQKIGFEFKWQGLNIVPVSESFRRHILYTQDKEGLFAVEMKMPGEDEDRSVIQPAHFELAQELWSQNPADPGVVKPVFYGQYKGRARMYGKPFDFSGDERLGVMVYEYQDGKRLLNVRHLLSQEDHLRALAGPAAAAIRLHDLGWSGATATMSDMHPENIRLLDDGQAVLAGDFGAFEKKTLTLGQRQSETLGLLGLSREEPGKASFFLNLLAPLVIERLSQGVSDPAERQKIRTQVRDELGVDESPVLGRNLI